MEKRSKKEYSLLDIARGKGIQKKYELYQSSISKEILLFLMNLCVIAALFLLEFFWAKAAADNAFLEGLFKFVDAPGYPPLQLLLLFGIYLLVFIFWLFPKLEIKMADKHYLWIKDNAVYVKTAKRTAVYANSDIRKIVLHHRSAHLKKIVIHTTTGEDTVFFRHLSLIPYSELKGKCDINITGFSTELITHLKMNAESFEDTKKVLRKEYSRKKVAGENDRFDPAACKAGCVETGTHIQEATAQKISASLHKNNCTDTTTEHIPPRRFWKAFLSALLFALFAYLCLLQGIQEPALFVKIFFCFFGAFFALMSMTAFYTTIFYKVPYKLSTNGIFIQKIGLVPWSSIVSAEYISSIGYHQYVTYSVRLELGDLSFLRKSIASEWRKKRLKKKPQVAVPTVTAKEDAIVSTWISIYCRNLKSVKETEISIWGKKEYTREPR